MATKKIDNTGQPGLFDPSQGIETSDVLKYALGDFADRGFELAGRELALDRLLGALKRAYVAFDVLPLSDSVIADALRDIGAEVVEIPGFVAKHPYRFTVNEEIAETSLKYFLSYKEK